MKTELLSVLIITALLAVNTGCGTAPASPPAESTAATNVDASGADTAGKKNYAKVELLDEAGGVIEGYSRKNCDPIHSNDVDHVVTWKGSGDVSQSAGRVIRLKVYLKGAELYALQFVK